MCMYIMQAARLLGLSFDKIILLDNKTKIVSKSQNTQDLLQVSEINCNYIVFEDCSYSMNNLPRYNINIGLLKHIFVYYIIVLSKMSLNILHLDSCSYV